MLHPRNGAANVSLLISAVTFFSVCNESLKLCLCFNLMTNLVSRMLSLLLYTFFGPLDL